MLERFAIIHRLSTLGWVFTTILGIVAVNCAHIPTADTSQLSLKGRSSEVRRSVTASVLISESPDGPVSPVTLIVVKPSAIVVDPGEIINLSATGYTSDGIEITDIQTVWSVADPRAGTVNRDGRFIAGTSPGVYDNSISIMAIQNTPQGIKHTSGSATVTILGQVKRPKLARVEIVSDNPSIMKRQLFRMSAAAFDQDGFLIPGVKFVWRLNHLALGEINRIGYLSVKADVGTYPDAVMVTAIWEGEQVSSTTDVRVISTPETAESMQVHALPQRFFLDPGDRLQLKAVALNGLGELIAGTQIRWEMYDPKAGTIDGNGNFIAGSVPGVFTEAVKVEAVFRGESGFVRASDYASVVIRNVNRARELNSLIVIPETLVLGRNTMATPIVRAIDNSGKPASDVIVNWDVITNVAGIIDDQGHFRSGPTPGVYPEALRVKVLQQTDGGPIVKEHTLDVVVTGSLTRVTVEPEIANIVSGRTVHFSTEGFDENEIRLLGLVVIWSVSDNQVGTIDPFGNFTAGSKPGFYQNVIRADIVQQIPSQR